MVVEHSGYARARAGSQLKCRGPRKGGRDVVIVPGGRGRIDAIRPALSHHEPQFDVGFGLLHAVDSAMRRLSNCSPHTMLGASSKAVISTNMTTCLPPGGPLQ